MIDVYLRVDKGFFDLYNKNILKLEVTDMVNPKAMEIFLAIVEHRSISHVARMTHFSQPTVSEYLSQLEDAVGTTLVLRGKGQRQISLTPAGEAFLPLAQRWMDSQLELENQIKRFRQTQTHGVLRLAASAGAHQTVAADVICKLMTDYPDIQLQLSNVERREMPDAIDAYAFDVAFMFGHTPESDLVTTVPLFEEPLYVLCLVDAHLPEGTITPAQLDPRQEIAYISHVRSEGFQQWHRSCFPETEPAFTASSLGAVHNYLTGRDSWAVVPASVALSNMAHDLRLTCRQIDPTPPPRRCSLLISKACRDEKAIRQFLRCCGELIDSRSCLRKLSR